MAPGAVLYLRRWAWAWASLTAAFGLHVLDEATHDFLGWYNPAVEAIRGRVAWIPLPTFSFQVWLAGLLLAVTALALLTPAVAQGRRWVLPLAYGYGGLHLVNACLHIGVSVAGGWFAPGVLSAPALGAAAIWLVITTSRVHRRTAVAVAPSDGQ